MKATAPRLKSTHQHIDGTVDVAHFDPSTQPQSPTSSSSPPSSPSFPSFKSTAKEVTAFGATKLPKWDRKAHEEKQRMVMGMRPAKRVKTPLKMLRGMRVKGEMRRERTEGRMRDSGLQVKSAKRKRRESRGSESVSRGGEDVGVERSQHSGGLVRVDRDTAQQLRRGPSQMSLAKRLKQR